MDLPTLWYLTIGTLLVGAGMTLWERNAHRHRSRQLGIWAASYVVFALGCLVAMTRYQFPGAMGLALTNILMVAGYLMVWHGVARFDGPIRIMRAVVLIISIALVWAVAGARYADALWNHVAAFPIALICGLTAWALFKSPAVAPLRSRPIAIAVFAGHGVFYVFRSMGSPILAFALGEHWLPIVAKATMYEAVLFSVAMPMAFLALVREEYQNQLLDASHKDFLTGLSNRRGFFKKGEKILREIQPYGPVSLLAVDLDHFKTINDRYGHDAGDRVLQAFAVVAREFAGGDGLAVRLGGEEFAILLPNQGIDEAREIGEALASRFSVSALRIDGLGIEATVSIGVAVTKPGLTNLSRLLSTADRALYRAKELGRNRIETAASIGVANAA
jgi:diguanylate cyclase (GGDEF)-like protein